MKIEIWSDVMCPYCYIAKRRFEEALRLFEHRGSIETIWRSFLLDPGVKFQPDRDAFTYLAARKKKTVEWSRMSHARVAALAGEAGLEYNFDRAIPASSFDAHRLSHLARRHGCQSAAEEALFSAYFTEGKNIEDHETLIRIGESLGLDRQEVQTMLSGSEFCEDVQNEIAHAANLGADGVPFFVLDDRYEIPGLQTTDVFLKFIRRAWDEREQSRQCIPAAEYAAHVHSDETGPSCSIDGCGPEF